MKTVVAGSRDYNDHEAVASALDECGWPVTEVVSGGARGVDYCGECWAKKNSVPVKVFAVTKADWNRLGRAAGPIRNRKMAEYADALIAVWDGESRGTASMIKEAKRLGLRVFVKRV